ncbi:MAG: selenocysteine-specific translation elongation factor [candidate division WOR-3 bacterium]|nr:selenocysteine-specific translation elongation factor [candidate division WOR-3 bacterium]
MSEVFKKHIVIGTAGHIDHGKSALIKSLTGTDPDRLKEEKERGMTTDLGFAFFGDDVTIIDVPGHEKFVRHMLAGASTIDFVLFVVAADDGVMPQTIEHFEILKLLQIKRGIIVITKIDLVDRKQIDIVMEDIKTLTADSFLQDAPVVLVSNITGEGIEKLKELLKQMINETEPKKDKGIFRMPVDRCFTMKGFGTVIAGTVLSGRIKVGDTVELLPQKKELKIRGIEVHNKKVPEVGTGFRAAINVAGVEKEEIERGNVIAQPGFFEPSLFMNGSLYLLKSSPPLKSFSRIRLHLGTGEIFARVVILEKKILEPGEKSMVQFRLESPAVCDIGDRFVIRTYSPPVTIGGGVILEPKAEKIKGFDEEILQHLQRIETQEPAVIVEEELNRSLTLPLRVEEIARDVNLPMDNVRSIINELVNKKVILSVDEKRGLYYSTKNLTELENMIIEILKNFHRDNPTLVGIPRLDLMNKLPKGIDHTLFNFIINYLKENSRIKTTEDGKVSLFDFKVRIDDELNAMVKRIERIYLDAGFQTPAMESIIEQKIGPVDLVKKAFRYLLDNKTLINVGEGVIFHKDRVEEAKNKLINFLKEKKEIRVAEFRDLINASRKYALPLLIYFDSKGITIKRGEVRVMGTGGGV